MSGHKHAELMLEYAKDAAEHEEPWLLWDVFHNDNSRWFDANTWSSLEANPTWAQNCKYRRKLVKWSPVGGTWHIDANGIFRNSISTKNRREFGTERPTEQQAERASVEMRKFNRLLALRDELCGDDEMDWSDASIFKYTLEFIIDENRWSVDVTRIYHKITVYFTTKKDADRACEMLNSGEVEL